MQVPQLATHCKHTMQAAPLQITFQKRMGIGEKRCLPLSRILCVCACFVCECGHVHVGTRVEVSVGLVSLVLDCQAGLQAPGDTPVSSSHLAVECWGYRYELLLSNQNSDPLTSVQQVLSTDPVLA